MELIFAVIVVAIIAAIMFIRSPKPTRDLGVARCDLKALEAIPSGILLVDNKGVVQHVNKHTPEILGYKSKELIGMTVEELMPERFRQRHVHLRHQYEKRPIERPMGQGRDLFVLTKDGEELPVEIALGMTSAISGDPMNVVVLTDVSERRKMEQKIEYMAYHDALTDLCNRDSFMERAKEAVARARDLQTEMVVMLVDINNFKRVNDTLGHHVGDAILQQMAAFLEEQVETKCEGEIPEDSTCGCFVARFGGDEFALVLEHKNIEVAKKLAARIHDRFKKPITVAGRETLINVSMGAAMFPHSGITLQQLLKGADLALHHAKRESMKELYVYDKIMTTQIEQFVRYENIIHHFIEHNDFILHYQPILDIHTNEIAGAEALFRSNPDLYDDVHLGLLIDVAEETGLIVELGNLIFRRACEDCYQCNIKLGIDKVISVNVSVRQLEQPNFVEDFTQIIKETKVNPRNIAIEVTETMVIANGRDVISKLLRMRSLGVHVYIDDFGKGYSSMTYLRRLPADKLKIDQAFIQNVVHDPMDAEIFSAINSVAQTLGLTTCAEGVETKEQLEVAKKYKVNQVQGYLTGMPMPHEQLVEVIKKAENIL